MTNKKTISAEEFDRLFDEGSDDIDQHIDWESARCINLEAKRVNTDFPAWMVTSLDRESARLGISRQALIKTWIAEKLDSIPPS